MKLDLKDRRILNELDFNARASYSEIGKKVRLNKQVVEYRINNLLKRGVITNFYPVINTPKLGYIYGRLIITLKNISPEQLDAMCKDLVDDRRVFWMYGVQGFADLFIGPINRSLEDFRQFIDYFMSKYSGFVELKTESLATDVIHCKHKYLLGKPDPGELHLKETDEREEIDDLDRKILGVLTENARTSLVEIGRRVKESAKTVAYRIRRLEKRKVILGYRPIINHLLLGYTYYKILLNLSGYTSSDLVRIKEFIKNNLATIYLIEGVGLNATLDFEMMIKDNQELFGFIKDLRKNFPKIVGSYQSVIFMDTFKIKYLPF